MRGIVWMRGRLALAVCATAVAVPAALLAGPWRASALGCTVSPGGIVYADQCVGTDAGAQIQAALTALGTNSGVVDARGIHTNLTITESLVLGKAWQSSVHLLLGPGNWMVSQPITVIMESSIEGAPVGMAVGGTDQPATNLVAAANALLSEVVQIGDGTSPGGFGSVLQDLVVDGNKANSGTSSSGAAILVNGAGRVDMTRVTAQNSAGDGILVKATTGNAAAVPKFTKIMAGSNAKNGLELLGLGGSNNPNDAMVIQSEFEGNGVAGVSLTHAGALRITQSDLSGNQTGLWTSSDSGSNTIVDNQFGDQIGHDIQLSAGTGNVINDNEFIGSSHRQSGYDAIQLWTDGGNTIVGNSISMTGLAYGIQFVNTSGLNTVMSNTFRGGTSTTDVFGPNVFPSTPSTYNLFG